MKKVVALIVALVSALAISVAAFAADPSYDSSVNGSKAITQDTCVSWLISQDKNGKLTEDVLNTGYLWSVYEARHVITATLRSSDEGFGYQFWYDDDGTFTCDMYSGSTKTRIAGKTSLVPAPDTAEAPSPGGKDLGGIITDVGTGVGGVFSISKSGFDFLTGNNLTMFILSISFAGVALGFVARAFRTSRK